MHPDQIPEPSAEVLSKLDRDIGFIPSDTNGLEWLAPNQVDQFNKQGFLAPFDGLSREETSELRNYFDGMLDAFRDLGRSSYSISTSHLRFARIYNLMSHPAILGPVSDLLGPNVVAWGAHFFCKLPKDGKHVPWHQDALYWPITPTRTVTVWLAIDDTDAENANMQFIPRSHLHGPIEFETLDDESAVLKLQSKNPEDYGDPPFDNILRAGQFSIHADLLLHGSEANESDRRRCGLTMRYAAADVKAYHDWHYKGILVKGEDKDGNWANLPCPNC
jgi:non-heme Fe2+,alpha-ketoglutarate-dependent halogenase